MREIITTVYKFDELSPKAQEYALDKWRNTIECDWYDYTLMDIETVGNNLGITIEGKTASFDLNRGRHFSFRGSYNYLSEKKERLVKEFGTYHKRDDSTSIFLQEFLKLEHSIQKSNFYGLHCKLTRSRYYGLIVDDCRCLTTTGYDNRATDVQEEALQELMELFTSYALQRLDEEWGYLNSDEYISDNMRDGAYEFTIEGVMV